MKKILLFTLILVLLNTSAFAQKESTSLINVDIDSLLSRYHLTGIKVIVNKVGIFSLKDKKLSLQRSDFDEKLLLTFSRSISLSNNNFGAKIDYKFSDRWLIRGESYRRSWGQQSSVNLLYQIEY